MKKEIIKTIVNGLFQAKSFSLYVLLVAFWIIEHMFLSLNAVFRYSIPEFADWYSEEIPTVIKDYNEKILDIFEEYYRPLLLFSIVLFVVGIFFMFYVMSYFGRDEKMRDYLSIPFNCAVWFLRIAVAYCVYQWSPRGYLLLPITFPVIEAYCLVDIYHCPYKTAFHSILERVFQFEPDPMEGVSQD